MLDILGVEYWLCWTMGYEGELAVLDTGLWGAWLCWTLGCGGSSCVGHSEVWDDRFIVVYMATTE